MPSHDRAIRRRYSRARTERVVDTDPETAAALDRAFANLDLSKCVTIDQFAADHGIALPQKRRRG